MNISCRLMLRRLRVLAACLALLIFAFLAWLSGEAWGQPMSQATAFPAGCEIGAFIGSSPPSASEVREFEDLIGQHVRSIMWYQAWDESSQPSFPTAACEDVRYHDGYDTHTVVHLTWEPWVDLSDIANGTYDSYLSSYAADCKKWGDPIRLRFAHEMIEDDNPYTGNPWYPWQDQPTAYVAAFRHVHDIFQAAGATNVEFVWCPGNWTSDVAVLQKYYPGPDYVDWLGTGGCNCGEDGEPGWPYWQWFDDIFYDIYHAFVDHPEVFGDKPVMIAELSSGEAGLFEQPGETKAAWIANACQRIKSPDYSRIKAFYWFHYRPQTGCDWRVNSSPESLAAFRACVSDPYFTSHPLPAAVIYLPLVMRHCRP